MTKFLIIDGNSLACRAEFAFRPHSEDEHDLMTSYGRVTGGTYRFVKMFNRLLLHIHPTHVAVCWDVNRNTWRRELYPPYKANRDVGENINKDSLYITFEDIKRILYAINVINVEFDGYEGDDLVGTFANISTADENYIASGDRDIFQLINENTFVLYPKNGYKEKIIIDEKYIKDKYDVTPKEFIYLKALMGDSGDNIPGIPGCAEKTAARLIHEFKNIDNIIKADKIETKGVSKTVINNIEYWKPNAKTMLKLVTIDKRVPIEIEFEDCVNKINWQEALPIFEELEFHTLIDKLKHCQINLEGDYNGYL